MARLAIPIIDFAKQQMNTAGEVGILAKAFVNAHLALSEIQKYNGIHNDLEAYLFDLTEWGMGERKDMPKPEDFGLKMEAG